MQVWKSNAFLTFLFGGFVVIILVLPYLIWSYHRYGRINRRRAFGWAAACVYITGLFTYVWFPLPENPDYFCETKKVRINTHPLKFVHDILTKTSGMSLTQAATSTVVLQVVFNIILFIPFGVFLRRYFHRGIIITTVAGLATSCFIEFSQYTALFGAFPCAYRVADIDDIITNVSGAFLGALIAPAILFWMPSARTAAARRMEARPITSRRRWLGMIIDASLLWFISTLLIVITRLSVRKNSTLWNFDTESIWIILAALLVFIIPALRGTGASLGQSAVWLAPRWKNKKTGQLVIGTILQRLIRALIVVGPFVISDIISRHIDNGLDSALTAISSLIIFLSIVMVIPTKNHRSLSGLITDATFVDIRATENNSPVSNNAIDN